MTPWLIVTRLKMMQFSTYSLVPVTKPLQKLVAGLLQQFTVIASAA
jgi:hypothetical protein